MTEHLPECLVPDFDKGLWICVCNQLRACERRVREDERSSNFTPDDHSDAMTEAAANAYARAIAAVVALEPRLRVTLREGGYDCCGCSTLDELYLDVIDALKAMP